MQPSKLKNIDVAIKLRQVIGFYLTPYYIEFAAVIPALALTFQSWQPCALDRQPLSATGF